jgi:3-isopropylmalate/(R)-2-methylmalate dehydratase small subunit
MRFPETIISVAAHLERDNIDTDAIMPSRELTQASRVGLASSLFAAWRYLDEDKRLKNPNFILNQKPFDEASIIVSGENFGCGSSREFAVWALVDFGIKVIFARSFGSIFYANCIRNDIAPLVLGAEAHRQLSTALNHHPGTKLMVSLADQRVTAPNGLSIGFDIDARDKDILITGRDEIAMTLEQSQLIDDWRNADRLNRPWIYEADL